jgi:acetyl esterase/lipase
MAGWLYLFVALVGAWLAYNAARPSHHRWWLVPSWLLAFLTTDLAFVHIAAAAVVTTLFAWGGALASLPGKIGLLIMVLSSLALVVMWLPNLKAAKIYDSVATELGLDEVERVPRRLVLTPFSRRREDVGITRNVEFFRAAGRSLKLDIYRPLVGADKRPALVYLHGGGWILGDKREQGIPLCNHLATLGWVCINANYRLSPGATYPDHVVDAKAAIAWLREHAADYGVDPDFIALAGGSAGAHIAAMTALTPGDRSLQPGFEDRDTSVQSMVTCYGVYDTTGRPGAMHEDFLAMFFGPLVIKAFPEEAPEKFAAASPRDHVDKVSMPWLALQGDADTLTPVNGARDFVAALREASDHVVGYGELPQAQHAFDIFYSPRAIAAVDLTARFLVTQHRLATEPAPKVT